MKLRILALLLALVAIAPAMSAQSVPLTLKDSTCAAAPAGSGPTYVAPCVVKLYRITVAATVASCPAFDASTWTLLSSTLAMPATQISYSDSNGVVAGNGYCYAGTVTWTAGGTGPSPLSNSFQTVLPLVPAALTISAG